MSAGRWLLRPWGYTRFETESETCPRPGSHTLLSTAVRGVGREEPSVPVGTDSAK